MYARGIHQSGKPAARSRFADGGAKWNRSLCQSVLRVIRWHAPRPKSIRSDRWHRIRPPDNAAIVGRRGRAHQIAPMAA